jgi:hypothetical protein
MAYGNEETSSTYYFTLLNTLPGVGSSATGKAAEQYGEQGVVVSTKGSSIGRGEIEYILRNDLWGLPKQVQVDKFKQKWPSKNPGKLQQICTAIRGGVKLETNELLGIEFEKYRLGKQSWDEVIEKTGFDPSIWAWAVFDNASPKVMYGGEPTYQSNGQIGPLAGLMSQFMKTPEYANIVAGNEIAASASDVVSGDGRAERAKQQERGTGGMELDDAGKLVRALDGADEDHLDRNPNAKEGLSEEQKIQNIKFQTQCLLAANLHEIAEFNQKDRAKSAHAYKKTYMLDGAPYKLINKLTYTPGSAAFSNITVPEVSSLVPMIRLEKLRYDSKGQYTGSVPIVFDTFTREDDLLADSGGRSGVGIKSFDWDYNGTNIATVKSDITAKLTLFFQTFNDLLAYNHLGFRYVDLLMRADPPTGQNNPISGPDADKKNLNNVNHDSKHFEIKATVGWAYNNDYILDYEGKQELEKGMKSQRASLFLTLVEHEFDIAQDGTFTLTINYRARMDGMFMEKRADVLMGFKEKAELCELNEELDKAKSFCDEDQITKIKKKISDSKQKYAFDSGTYVIDQLLTTGKLFYGKLSKTTLQEFDYDVFDIPAGRMELTSGSKLLEVTQDMAQQMAQDAIRDVASNYGEVHRMRGTATVDWQECQDSYVGLAGAGLGYLVGLVGSGFDQAAEYVTGTEGLVEFDGSQMVDEDGAGREIGCLEAGVRLGDFDPAARQGLVDISAPDPQGLEKVGLHTLDEATGDVMIPYFFLGDLIDIVANKALGEENASTEGKCNAYLNPARTRNMSILLGSINVRSLGKSTYGASNRDLLINIGDIPVALEYFRDFWSRRVTKQKKTTYSLNGFIKDCLKDFGLRALGEQCFKERPEDLQIKDATIMLPGTKSGGTLIDPIRERIYRTKPLSFAAIPNVTGAMRTDIPSLHMSRLDMKKVDSASPINWTQSSKQSVDDTFHYKLFYLQNKSAANMTGNKSIDEKNGIIHLGIGQDRGLLKNIGFKRANFPGLREQRVVETNAFNPLSHLADVYNVEISMIGNTIFYPGQYIYVNPLGFGSKLGKTTTASSPSRAMGLGGYHLVTQVSSFIESGKFETTVTALWETSGGEGADRNDRGESTGTKECVGIDDEASTVPEDIKSNIADAGPETQ